MRRGEAPPPADCFESIGHKGSSSSEVSRRRPARQLSLCCLQVQQTNFVPPPSSFSSSSAFFCCCRRQKDCIRRSCSSAAERGRWLGARLRPQLRRLGASALTRSALRERRRVERANQRQRFHCSAIRLAERKRNANSSKAHSTRSSSNSLPSGTCFFQANCSTTRLVAQLAIRVLAIESGEKCGGEKWSHLRSKTMKTEVGRQHWSKAR